MTNNSEALLKLIRISLGKEIDFTFPSQTNWREVLDMSVKQGVDAIVSDGVNIVYQKVRNIKINGNENDFDDLRYEWMGRALLCEKKYHLHWAVVSEIANILSDEDAKLLLLKGLGLSLYYPNPKHRLGGDIDIYIKSNKKISASDWDRVIKDRCRVKVAKSKISHHSHFNLKGVTVEHHYEFGNTYYRDKRSLYIENQLENLSDLENKKCGNFYIPSADFNAVFLMFHLSSHFISGKMNIRQLCDWMLFLEKECSNINWKLVREIWGKLGLRKFADIINGILEDWFGLDGCLYSTRDEKYKDLEVRLLDEILNYPNGTDGVRGKIKRYVFSGWKRSILNKSSWFGPLRNSFRLHLFHSEDMLVTEID